MLYGFMVMTVIENVKPLCCWISGAGRTTLASPSWWHEVIKAQMLPWLAINISALLFSALQKVSFTHSEFHRLILFQSNRCRKKTKLSFSFQKCRVSFLLHVLINMLIVFLIKTEEHVWLSAQGLYPQDWAGPFSKDAYGYQRSGGREPRWG